MARYADPERPGGVAPASRPIRLVLAHRDLLVLEALAALFERAGGFAVAAHCRNGEELPEAVRQHAPDVLVLDLRLPRMDGLEVVRQLKRERAPARLVLLADWRDEREVVEAMRLGVGGVILWEMPASLLVRCVRAVHAGEPWFEKRSVERMMQKLARTQDGRDGAAGKLTQRELAVVRLVGKGLRNRVIAAELGISESTVKVHLGRIYAKLGAKGRLGLYRFAADNGLL